MFLRAILWWSSDTQWWRGRAIFGKKFASLIGVSYKDVAGTRNGVRQFNDSFFLSVCVLDTGWEGSVLTDHKKQASQSSTTVIERDDLAILTPEEEKVLRMAHGLTEDDDHALSFAVGASEETCLKLALIEKELMMAFQKAAGPDLQLEEHHIDAKARIIDKLRNQ